ncbi:MAG TPA: hypothetical protein VGQ09_05575 [Chitinophagaceae bacterium]|nr:hypothetical protein [Chitinophagaceae bacterium]
MKRILLLTAMFVTSYLNAQFTQNRIKLYIDCSNIDCDFDFIRQQIPIADFVRDRKESDVHVLIINQQAGSGGQEFTVQFLGQNQFQPLSDTLHFFMTAGSTENSVREKLVQVIKAGIVPCLARLGVYDQLNISFVEKEKSTVTHSRDKWNYWNFKIGGNVNFSGDKNYKQKRFGGNFFAGRTTEKSKLEFFVFNSSSTNKYIFEEEDKETELTTHNNYFEAEQNFVKSLSKKWSAAFETAVRKSSYDNLKNAISAATGIEYNIFPYKLSSTKFLVLRYMLEAVHRNYLEETIYDKDAEMLVSNNLGLYAAFTQPWGSLGSGISYYSYFNDLSKTNLSVEANVELQLFKGVSINFYGNASLIKDQRHLSKQGATSQEVLLRLKALSTSYNYHTGIAISYRFGSRFNNIVNPRFTNGRF